MRKRQWFKLVGPLYSWLLNRRAIQLLEGGIDVRVNFGKESKSGKLLDNLKSPAPSVFRRMNQERGKKA